MEALILEPLKRVMAPIRYVCVCVVFFVNAFFFHTGKCHFIYGNP